MKSTGDIYSKKKVKKDTPWKGERHRKPMLSADPEERRGGSKDAGRSSRHSTRRRNLRSKRRRRMLVSVLLLLLLIYIGYTGLVALRGAMKYKGIDPGDFSIASLFRSKESEPVASILPEGDYEAESFPIKDVIGIIDKSRSAEMDVRNLLDKDLAEQALDRYATVKDGISPSEELLRMLAVANMRAGRYASALPAIRRSLELDPEDVEMRENLAETLFKLGDFKAATAAAQWALNADSNSVKAHKVLADSYSEAGMSKEAVSEFRRVLAINPNDDETRSNLALAYYNNGEYGRAVNILIEMIRRGTDSSPAYYNLAICYAKQSLVDETVEVLMKARRKFGSEFVRAWIRGKEFDVFEDNTKFILFTSNLDRRPDIARIRPEEHGQSGKQISIGTSPIKLDDRTDSLINR